MQIKKLLLFIGLASYCHLGFADVANGPYVGLGAGWNWNLFEFNTINNSLGFASNRNILEYNIFAHPFIGYGRTFNIAPCHLFTNTYYLGMEAGAYVPNGIIDINTPDVTLTTPGFLNHQVKFNNYLAVDFTPGITFNHYIVLLARFGYSYSRFTLNQRETPGINGFSISHKLNGLRYGISINYNLTCHLSCGIDWIYTRYQKFIALGPAPDLPTIDYSFRPTTQNIGMSLRYNF